MRPIFLRRGAGGVFDYFVNRGGKLIHPRARDDDCVTTTVRFLSDAQEFPTIISRNSTWKCLRSICRSLASMRLSMSAKTAEFRPATVKKGSSFFEEKAARQRLY